MDRPYGSLLWPTPILHIKDGPISTVLGGSLVFHRPTIKPEIAGLLRIRAPTNLAVLDLAGPTGRPLCFHDCTIALHSFNPSCRIPFESSASHSLSIICPSMNPDLGQALVIPAAMYRRRQPFSASTPSPQPHRLPLSQTLLTFLSTHQDNVPRWG